ncbi:hypothetical protein BGZ79_003217 [Entomortierella chlamydospora]|nr:hypothetical protein BGZ79_003217 [Entomortierella chlamydospora]
MNFSQDKEERPASRTRIATQTQHSSTPRPLAMKEKDLLSTFLVGNELHDVVTFNQFTQFFPHTYRSHPEVKDLYRVYQNARHQARTKVKRNIDIEVRRNPFHLDQQGSRHIAEEEASTDDDQIESRRDDALEIDIEDVDKHLTLDQAIQELLQAENIYKREIDKLEKECQEFAQEFQSLDRDMDSIQVTEGSQNVVDAESLITELQDLIKLCSSIMDPASMESHLD